MTEVLTSAVLCVPTVLFISAQYTENVSVDMISSAMYTNSTQHTIQKVALDISSANVSSYGLAHLPPEGELEQSSKSAILTISIVNISTQNLHSEENM